jgi:hypothetical protein
MSSLEGVHTGPSGVSLPDSRAVHLDPALAGGPQEAFLVGSEFAHLHGAADGSLHLMLPPDVAGEAMVKGWAELHPMARKGLAPTTLLMLYGPRDQAELETIWQLVEASYEFARGAAD